MAKPSEFASTGPLEVVLGIERISAQDGEALYRVPLGPKQTPVNTLAITTAVDLALVRAVSTVIDSTVEEMNGTIEFSVSYLKTPSGHADVLAKVLGRGENTAVISVTLTDQDNTHFGFAKGSYSISKKNPQEQ